MRIASGGIQHETNTFATVPTRLADFQRDSQCGPDFASGQALVDLYRGTNTVHGGFLTGAEEAGVELLPLLCAHAQPAGVVEQTAFDTLLETLLTRLRAVLPVDGVLLDLHGAMVADRHDDAEGAILAAVRELIGPSVPLVATLDLHGNVTRQMVNEADALIGFDTYPHVDMHDRGREALDLIVRTCRGEVAPARGFRQLPLVTMPPKQCTLRQPMQGLLERLHAVEQRPGVLTATVMMGFPFADIADAGVSVLVTTNYDQALARRTADELAAMVWALRDEFQPELMPVDEVIRFARHEARGLVIYADGSDNPGGGAPCDGTVALRRLIEVGFEGAVVGVLFDPETVAQAHAAGQGATIAARIGGKTDDRHGAPVETKAVVQRLGDGRFVHRGPMGRGLPGDLGPMAVLAVGGVEVVLASRRRQLLDAEMLRIVGIEPAARKLLVVKSAVHFRADLGPLAAHIFDADTPGIHRPDFGNYTYRKLRRPIYPLDREARLEPVPAG
jgi:microcystin degradation protein MlrC